MWSEYDEKVCLDAETTSFNGCLSALRVYSHISQDLSPLLGKADWRVEVQEIRVADEEVDHIANRSLKLFNVTLLD